MELVRDGIDSCWGHEVMLDQELVASTTIRDQLRRLGWVEQPDNEVDQRAQYAICEDDHSGLKMRIQQVLVVRNPLEQHSELSSRDPRGELPKVVDEYKRFASMKNGAEVRSETRHI